MKLNDLLEMSPYNPKGEEPPKHWKETFDMFLSDNTLQRLYDHLIDLNTTTGIEIKFYLHQNKKIVYGGIKSTNEVGDEGVSIVFVLQFKSKPTLINYPKGVKRNKLLQVNKVNTKTEFEGQGIAMFIYQTLVKNNILILSDITKLDGGKALWKKMARRSHLHDYKIRILDNERGFLKDSKGNIIEYNNTNLDDSQIWTSGLDFSGEHLLLLMSLK